MERTIIAIADPSLRDSRGHHFELSKLLTPSLAPDNIKQVWFVNSEFTDDYDDIRIYPVFTYTMYDRYANVNSGARIYLLFKRTLKLFVNKFRLIGLANRLRNHSTRKRVLSSTSPEKLASELKYGIEKAGLSASDHVLFHTADAPLYWAILILFMQSNPDILPAVHLSTPYIPDFMPNKDITFPIIFSIALLQSAGLLNKKVFLYAETEILAEHLCSLWDTTVKPLCLPPPNMDLSKHSESARPITIAMLGAAREEKGFLLLPDIVESLWNEYGKSKKIRFVIQCNPQIVGYTQKIRETIDILKNYNNSYIQLIEQQQSSDEYYQCLNSSDIVLLIYDRDKYGIRGSGIATESVSLAKPILATRDTFPESLLKYGAGESASDLEGYIEALKNMIDKYHVYYDKALDGARTYRETYSVNNYLGAIISSAIPQSHTTLNPRVLVSNSESASLSACCRLLELIHCLLGLGYKVDVIANTGLVNMFHAPDINLQLRLIEFFGEPSLPGKLIRIIPDSFGDQLQSLLAAHARMKSLNNGNDNIHIENIYSFFITENSKTTKDILSVIPAADICQLTLRYFAQYSGSNFRYRRKSLKNRPLIAPCLQITTIAGINSKHIALPSLAPPVSTGKVHPLFDDGLLMQTGIKHTQPERKYIDLAIIVSDLMLVNPDINRILDKLILLLDNPNKLRIFILNSDYAKSSVSSSDHLHNDLHTLLLSDAVLTIENTLTENSIYKILSIYHFVPVVCALQLNKRNQSRIRHLPAPVFNNLHDAASYLNKCTASSSSLASASWKTYLHVTDTYNSDRYRQAWIDAIRPFHGKILPGLISERFNFWSAPKNKSMEIN